jgi:hypothetical protein
MLAITLRGLNLQSSDRIKSLLLCRLDFLDEFVFEASTFMSSGQDRIGVFN